MGIAASIAGLAILFLVGRKLAEHVYRKAVDERRLMTTGVHRYVRHPFYLHFVLLPVGLFLITLNYLALLVLVVRDALGTATRHVVDARRRAVPPGALRRRRRGVLRADGAGAPSPAAFVRSMLVRPATEVDRPAVDAFLQNHGSASVARLGELVEAQDHPALVANADGRLTGVLTFVVMGDRCEVLTLHATERGQGVGSALLDEVARVATAAGCRLLWLVDERQRRRDPLLSAPRVPARGAAAWRRRREPPHAEARDPRGRRARDPSPRRARPATGPR